MTVTPIEHQTGGFQAPDSLAVSGSITLEELNPPNRAARMFTAIMMKPAIPTAGYGGWSRVARPRRLAITEWVGRDALSITIQFMLDEFSSGEADFVEDQCRVLEKFAGVDQNDPPPPLLELSSDPEALIPHNEYWATQNQWFVEDLQWDADNTIYNSDGHRVRSSGTVIITVYSADEILSTAARNKPSTTTGASSVPAAKRKTYKVKRGDTLSKIAARKDVYGNSKKWKVIAKANHIRDPKHLKIGQELKIP